MKKLTFLIMALGIVIFLSCHKESPSEAPQENSHPQVDIPWPSLADSPWPMFHHDPQSTGRSQYIGPRKGKIKWSFQPEGKIHESIAIGPDSTICFVSLYERRDERQKSSLYAVKPDGSLKWRYLFDVSSWDAKPIVMANGTVILYVPELPRAVYAISADGSLHHKITPGLERFDHISIGLDGTLYFTADDGYLYAMDQQGTLIWRVTIEHGYVSKLPVFSPDGNTIYIFQHQEPYHVAAFCALDISGSLKWRFAFNDTLCMSIAVPTIDNEGNIYVGVSCQQHAKFYSLSPQGEINWSYEAKLSGQEEATIDSHGNIYFQSNANDFQLISLDYSGNFRWLKHPNYRISSLFCDRENVIYAFQPDLSAFNSDGQQLWRVAFEGDISRITCSAIGFDGILYVGVYGSVDKLYAIE